MSDPDTRVITQLTRDIERLREATERKMALQIRYLLIPMIEHMQKKEMEKYHSEFAVLIRHIDDITSGFATRIQENNALSFGEMRIALMIKNGLSNVEIAEYLHITPQTVKTYRRNIRRKLGLSGTKSDLDAHLHALA